MNFRRDFASCNQRHHEAELDPAQWPIAIACWERMLDGTHGLDDSVRRLHVAMMLADACRHRYDTCLDPCLLDKSERLLRDEALPVVASLKKPLLEAGIEFALGSVCLSRYEGSGASGYADEADRHFRRAIANSGGPGAGLWDLVHHNRGNLLSLRYIASGAAEDFREAVLCFQSALSVRERNPRSLEFGRSLNSLASLYLHRYEHSGETSDSRYAEEFFDKSLKVFEPAAPMLAAIVRSNLGNLYASRHGHSGAERDAATAEEHYRAALERVPRAANPDHWGGVQASRGALWTKVYERNRALGAEPVFEAAAGYLRDALEVYQRKTAPLAWAGIQQSLGLLYSHRFDALGRDTDAQAAHAHFRLALRVCRRRESPATWARAHLGAGYLALLRFRGGQRQTDARAGTRHFSLVLAASGLPDTYTASAAADLMKLRALAKDWAGVVTTYSRIGPMLETYARVQTFLAREEDWLRLAQGLPALAGYACAALGRRVEAAGLFERGLGRRLAAAFGEDRLLLETRIRPEHPADYDALNDVAMRLQTLADALPPWTPPSNALQRHVETTELRAKFNDIVERIRRTPGCAGLFQGGGIDDVTAAATPGTALVYVKADSAGTVALVVTRDGSESAIDFVWAAELDTDAVERLLLEREGGEITGGYCAGQLFDDDEAGLHEAFHTALNEILPRLGEQLFSGVAAHLRRRGVDRIVLLPVGRLALLPLHAATFTNGNRTVCLLEEFVVTYAPSARALTHARVQAAARHDAPPCLGAVGNPLPSRRPLPFAKLELAAVAASFPDARLLYGLKATKSAVMSLLTRCTHLHFACHGVFDSDKPLRSRLELAGGDELSLGNLQTVNSLVSTQLVVLSACRTAIPYDFRLPDEPTGLAAGFLEAGTPAVVAALWPVEDLASALLMKAFYEGFRRLAAPLPPASALQRAQGWLREITADLLCSELERWLDTETDPVAYAAVSDAYRQLYRQPPDMRPFRDPYYWAAFTFTGA